MSNTPKLAVGIFAALVILVAAVALIWLFAGREAAEPPVEVAVTPVPTPEPTPSLEQRLSERLKGVTLSTSDEAIRQLAAGLSARPEVAVWLANEDLVRRFVASVDSVADGRSPSQQVEFLRPSTQFRAVKRGDRLVVDPASYQRYDALAAVVASLDTDGTVALLRELEPLVDDAYAEIAPSGASFDDRLVAAIDHLLAVPVVDGDVELEQKVMTFSYADPRYENLSSAQRQLLRMGPDNVRKVQAKLREIKAAITLGAGT